MDSVASERDMFFCPVRAQAIHHPDRAAVYLQHEAVLSYSAFDHIVSAVQRQLVQQVAPGDQVLIQLGNSLQQVILLLALWRCRAVVIPLNPAISAGATTHLAGKVDACFAFPESTADVLQVPLLQVTFPDHSAEWQRDESQNLPIALGKENQPVTLLFTSGSTGEPKVVAHSLRNYWASALGTLAELTLQASDCWLLSLPLYHVGGLATLWRVWLAGAALAIATDKAHQLAVYLQMPITHSSLVATQLQRLLAQGLSSHSGQLKTIIMGGGPVPDSLLAALPASIQSWMSYGLTEMTAMVTLGRWQGDSQQAGECLPHRQIKLHTSGEIWVRGETLCLGYWQQGKIKSVINEDGWFATRDIGQWHPVERSLRPKQLKVLGRLDAQFISGGENIQPEAIESILYQQPGVQRAWVCAIADDEFGQRPAAVIEVSAACHWQPTLWQRAITDQLPCFWVPDYWLEWPEDLQAEGLKVSRRQLQKWAELQLELIAKC